MASPMKKSTTKQPPPVDEAPRMGRPPVAQEDRRKVPMHVLTTQAERNELEAAAATAGMGVSTWVRVVALEKARRGST